MSAREFHSAFSAEEVSNTSTTTWARVGELDFVAKSGVDYVVFWSFEGAKALVTSSVFLFRVTVDGVAIEEGQIRPRTISDYPLISGFLRIGGKGLGASVAIEIINAQGAEPVLGRNASLVAVALAEGDLYAEHLPRIETASSTLAPLVEATANSLADDYLVLGMSFTDNNNTTAPTYGGLNVNGAASATHMVAHGSLTDVRPLWGLWRRTLQADAPLTVQWCGRSHVNTAICGWRSNRVLALKLGGFVQSAYTEEIVNPTGSAEAFVEALSLHTTVSPNPHLLLTSFQTGAADNAVLHAVRVTEDGVEIGRGTQRTYATTTSRAAHQGFVGLRDGQPEGARTWRLERASDGTAAITLVTGSAMALLDLGASGRALTAEATLATVSTEESRLRLARWLAGARAYAATAGLDVSLSRGFHLSSAPSLFSLSRLNAALGRGFRASASTGALLVVAAAAGLAKQGSGRRISCALAAMRCDGANPEMRAERRRDAAAGALDWARLAAILRRNLRLSASAGSLWAAGRVPEWSQVFVMRPRGLSLVCTSPPARLAYSGQKFWQASIERAEAWTYAPARRRLWEAQPLTSETWN